MIKTGQTIIASDFVTQLVAGEALTANDAVYLNTGDGKAYKADADDVNKLNFIGFANETVSLGANVNIVHSGQMSGFSGLTIGADYYLSTTAGAISATVGSIRVGTALTATVIKIEKTPSLQVFTASGTWYKPTFAKFVRIVCIGAGGGGGSTDATSTRRAGGGGGGAYVEIIKPASELGTSVAVTVGAGGTAGLVGGDSSFGSFVTAYGGGGGDNASTATGTSGGGGGGALSVGAQGSGTSAGGAPGGGAVNTDASSGDGGGGGGDEADVGRNSLRGGGGGAGGPAGAGNGLAGGNSVYGGAGGGSGSHSATGGAGGTSQNAGAGGAGGSITNGSNGAAPGGGGGGAGSNAVARTGGTGGRGEVRVYCW